MNNRDQNFPAQSLIGFRAHAEIARAIKEMAQKENLTVSAWLMNLIKRELRRQGVKVTITKELV